MFNLFSNFKCNLVKVNTGSAVTAKSEGLVKLYAWSFICFQYLLVIPRDYFKTFLVKYFTIVI